MALAATSFNINNTLGNIQDDWIGGNLVCTQYYGSFADPADCHKAIDLLPSGNEEVSFSLRNQGDNRLPLSREFGKCMVQVEVAGERIPPVIRLVPDEVRTVASYIIEKCALESGGPYGGFGTGNLGKIKEWIVSPEGDLDKPQPYSTAFPTITISNPVPDYFSPGNFDLDMALYFARAEFDAAKILPADSARAKTLRDRGVRLMRVKELMDPRGLRVPWWRDPGERVGEELDDGVERANATADALEGVALVRPGATAGRGGAATAGGRGEGGEVTARTRKGRRRWGRGSEA